MKRTWIIQFVLFAALGGSAGGQPQEASAHALFGEYTVAVARVDVSRLDGDAAIDTLLRLIPASKRADPDLAEHVDAQRAALHAFQARCREAGLAEMYFAFDLGDLGWNVPVFAVFPGGRVPDPEAGPIEAALMAEFPFDLDKASTVELGGMSVMAGARTLERLQDPAWQADPDWEQAFAALPPAMVQVVIRPYGGWERVVEELLPRLPAFLGGGPATTLTRGVNLIWLAADAPPHLSLQAGVQSDSQSDAEALRLMIRSGLERFGAMEPVRDAFPGVDDLVAALAPEVRDAQVHIALDAEELEGHLSALAEAMAEGSQDARKTRSLSVLRQIGIGCIMYAADHAGQWPDHLAQLQAYGIQPDMVLTDRPGAAPEDFVSWPEERQRAWFDEHAAFAYVRPAEPADESARPTEVVLAYSLPDTAPWLTEVAVVFADGHAEVLSPPEAAARGVPPARPAAQSE